MPAKADATRGEAGAARPVFSFQRICLLHYHEIGLKGHNRKSFEMRLLRNVEALLQGQPIAQVNRISGRICVHLTEKTPYQQACEIADMLASVPGVARVSCGYKTERDIEIIKQAACEALHDVEAFESFKVAARRSHTDFPIDSMEMNQIIGAALCEAFPNKRVQMKHPDVELRVEVVEGAAYVCARSLPGVGGLPVGSSGTVVCLLSSGIDSPVATWCIARRGAICVGVHFSGRPQTSSASEYLVDDIAQVLERTGCIARVYVVPFGDYQREIALSAPPALRVVLYRRLMYRVAERIAQRERAGALVTGESLGQVASQTLENIAATNEVVSLPIFRPLIGTDKKDIIADAEALGTFAISSQDAPDCCTLFMPRRPETHAKLAAVHAAEEPFPIDTWVEELVELAEVRDYRCPAYKPARTGARSDCA